MKIGGEEVELVTSFEQLRAGMIVWVTPCRWCPGRHRHILIGRAEEKRVALPGGERAATRCVEAIPKPSCCMQRVRTVSEMAVDERRVYRVVDPLMKFDTRERAKELAR